ncbi:hypothetical protein BD413DRAFT_480789 [Trametes elegans]|nr:hypothetical protein BD413DRAFT_480789 [Trametes elegans]
MIIANPDQPTQDLKVGPPVPPKGASEPAVSTHSQKLPPPPPYSQAAGPSHAPAPPPLPPQRSASSIFSPQNAQTVNHFELFSKHNAIAGTFLIDPLMQSPVTGSLRRMRRKRNKGWGKHSRPNDIHASFRTRHGAISLDMAVVADAKSAVPPGAQKVPACVIVSSRHGRVNVNLFDIQPGRTIDLQIESQHGAIAVLLPPTYNGPLLFQTRSSNAVSFLPAFAARARTLRASDRETLVLCTAPDADSAGAQPKPPAPATGRVGVGEGEGDGDRVLVRTRHGRVIVGVSGLDKVEEAQGAGGLFKRLGELLEVGGRALGQYVEAHANQIERKLTERGALLGQSFDTKSPTTRVPVGQT